MKLRSFAIVLVAGLLISCDDEVLPEKVPLEVRQNLLSAFPLAFDIEWEKSGKDYEADFTVHAAEHSALFRQSGELRQYKRALPASELPEPVASFIAQHYPIHKIEEAEAFIKEGTTFYQVELKTKSTAVKLVFSSEGHKLNQPYWD